MQLRQLGNSNLMVSPIAVGFWGIVGGDYWGPQDETDTINTVSAALDAGINFIDTAEGYGNGYSEEMLGRALKGRRDEAIIATKVSQANLAPADIRAACERSLKRLDTDTIDLYQIHWPSRTIPFEDSMSTLLDLQREGKIRVIGVSNFGKRWTCPICCNAAAMMPINCPIACSGAPSNSTFSPNASKTTSASCPTAR